MVYEGWLSVGGVPVANNALTYQLLQRGGCPPSLFRQPPCMTTLYLDEDAPASAPWLDGSQPELAERFFGVYVWPKGVKGLSDTNRSTEFAEGIDDGGDIGRTRRTMRQVRVDATLFAIGRDALDYGVAWLSAALDGNRCGQHGSGCGTTDVEFFTDCPPERGDETEEEYRAEVDTFRRFLHDVAVSSGPLEKRVSNRDEWWMMDVEWTMTAARAWIFSRTATVDLPVTPSTIVQDVPYNLAPYPSAELAGDPVLTARNYAPNPSVETNATGWGVSQATIPVGQVTSGRVAGELAAVGTASYRRQFTATSAGSSGALRSHLDVPLPSLPEGARYSLSMWGASLVLSGSVTLGDITFRVEWYDAGNALLSDEVIGTAEADGGAASLRSVPPPADATRARVIAELAVASWASGSVTNFYADAVAVTVP